MELDNVACYQAVLSRDRRFDGHFFAGVVTTRIYCRPVCPVPAAKAENFRWFACAAAAEAAGFRPCRRCRPEAAPGTPAWLGSSSVVRRGLRLIAQGALDDGDVEKLAARLGIGARQLRRLFTKHLGASPAAVAGVRRVHFAATLLAETDLPITEVAMAAGFSSIRQFNHAFRARFRESPTEQRRYRETEKRPIPHRGADRGLMVRLPYRAPLDWAAIISFLKARATPGIEVVEDSSYRRTIEVNGAIGTVEVRPVARESQLSIQVQLPVYESLSQVVERARRVFDLDTDPLHITEHLRKSPQLRALVERSPGLRVPGAWDGFEVAVQAVLGHQVTVVTGTRLAKRLVKLFGKPIKLADRGLTHVFPRPETLAEADLSRIGLSPRQAAAIRDLASAVATGALSLEALPDSGDALPRLCAIPGIDRGTAQYIAMRGLGEPDTFPITEIGLRRVLARGGTPFSAAALECLAETWRPWRAYAAMHLWSAHNCRREGTADMH